MMQIQLNPDEATMLHKILESYLSDLRVEISKTEIMDLRQALKKDEGFIKNLLQRLEGEGLKVSR